MHSCLAKIYESLCRSKLAGFTCFLLVGQSALYVLCCPLESQTRCAYLPQKHPNGISPSLSLSRQAQKHGEEKNQAHAEVVFEGKDFFKASSSISAESRWCTKTVIVRICCCRKFGLSLPKLLLLKDKCELMSKSKAADKEKRRKKRTRPCPRQPTKQRSSSVGRDWSRHTCQTIPPVVSRR